MSSIAKIAVSAATYWMDRPYDYRIPQNLSETVLPGMRVLVPFGRGNRRSEGIVLALADKSEYNDPKPIEKILDEKALLSDAQLKLALWMRERFFCTVYDAVKAMLPAGLWYKEDGVRKIGDKTVKMAELSISAEEALILASQKLKRAPNQSELLKVLCNVGRVSVNELCYFTGASKQSLNALERIGVIEFSEQEVYRRPSYKTGERTPLPELNESQLKAFNGISKLTKRGKAEAALLFGVTGSGKTTIYIRLIAQQLEMGKAIYHACSGNCADTSDAAHIFIAFR
jgi:Primosomal protein N'' (replication factor Y) - superfamily II helicase